MKNLLVIISFTFFLVCDGKAQLYKKTGLLLTFLLIKKKEPVW
jgi:hypothetical protein